MKPSIITSFLELGDATSCNLEFSYRDNVLVSYGEETITEINLLEIRRRHPERVHVQTSSKPMEGRIGADWEWHIIGRKRTAKMRVQAKRLQRNDVLKIKYVVRSSGQQQRQLLIDGAKADNMKPVYCIYCTEPQRMIWKQPAAPHMFESYQTGCLLADAYDVPLITRKLDEIADKCIPWHFLFERSAFAHRKREFILADYDDHVGSVTDDYTGRPISSDADEMSRTPHPGWHAPTIDDLNQETGREFDRTGIDDTKDEDRERLRPETDEGQRRSQYDRDRLRERGIRRMMVIDVQDEARFERRERP